MPMALRLGSAWASSLGLTKRYKSSVNAPLIASLFRNKGDASESAPVKEEECELEKRRDIYAH